MHAQPLTEVGRETLEQDVADYLASKRRRLTDASYKGYVAALRELAAHFAGRDLADFELPAGAALVEDFLAGRWGASSARTFNKNLSIVHGFFEWQVRRGHLHGDPTLPIERAKARPPRRWTFTETECDRILDSNTAPRDGIGIRLLLFYGIRKGALRGIRFEHFDRERRRLEIFTKGEKTQVLPIGDEWIWDALAKLLEAGGQPGHYLLPSCRRTQRRTRGRQAMQKLEQHLAALENGSEQLDEALAARLHDQVAALRETLRIATLPEIRIADQRDGEPMGEHGLHHLWYLWLERAAIVEPGVAAGRKMHASRHTAGQRVLDHTGNLKAVQTMLGHSSIGTTGNSYTDWGEGRLDETLEQVLRDRRGAATR
jgi:integrase